MVGRRAYDLMYRWWAPWDAAGVRPDLRRLLDDGGVSPATHPRAVDLGCGTGANAVFLATRGFDVTGIDFSPVALRKAAVRARSAGVGDQCRFVRADLTGDALPAAADGPFDLLLDFGTLDDLDPAGRGVLARHIARLARPGSSVLFWCFYASVRELPLVSLSGPSRLTPPIQPGEEERLFGSAFTIETFSRDGRHQACFLMRRRDDGGAIPEPRPQLG